MALGVGQGRPHCEIFSFPLPLYHHSQLRCLPRPYFQFSVFSLYTVCMFLLDDVTSGP